MHLARIAALAAVVLLCSFARAADDRGVDIIENCEVTAIRRDSAGAVEAVETTRGLIRTKKVGVVAAGANEWVVTTANGTVARWTPGQEAETLGHGFEIPMGVALSGKAVVFADAGAGKVLSLENGVASELASGIKGGDEVAAKDVAMHVAAMKPVSLTSADVPAELIEKERAVATAKAAESGKPADIAAKMIEGSVQKYLKEVSLFNQPFVKNDKQTVEQMLKAANTTVKAFTLYVVGEGIEKKVDDFAAEVAAQVAAAKGAA